MDKLQLKEAILKRIRRPEILQAEYPAEDLGVLPDTGKIQTAALQKAIDRVHDQGGGGWSFRRDAITPELCG